MLRNCPDDEPYARCIRLVIAERLPILLQGLTSVFSTQSDFEIIASCSDATALLEAVQTFSPDIALISDSLPRPTLSAILTIVKAEKLPTRLVLFTEHEHDELTSAIAAGDCGAISKLVSSDTLLGLLRSIAERSAPPEGSQSPVEHESDSVKLEKVLGLLTQRERQIVQLVSDGLSNKEIARQLNLSLGTIKVHLHNIFQKLAINNRTMLATLAVSQRSAGLGTLLLTAYAFAMLDDVKASDNDSFDEDDSTRSNGGPDHLGFTPRRSGVPNTVEENNKITASAVFDSKAGVRTSPAISGSLEAGHPIILSASARSEAPPGSGSLQPPSSSPLLPMANYQIGAVAQQQFPVPPLSANQMKGASYGIFTALAGAWIFALESSRAVAQSLGTGEEQSDDLIVAINHTATKPGSTTGHREFTSGAGTINLTAFGSLALLQMRSASQSVPPHTLAWIYNSATDETIVYVNQTDRSLDVGDASLLEIHVRGFVSAETLHSMFGSQAALAAAASLENTDAVGITDKDVSLTTDAADPFFQSDAEEGASGSAHLWTMPADNGFGLHFERARIGANISSRSTSASGDLPNSTQETNDRVSTSVSVSPIVLAGIKATNTFDEIITSKKEALDRSSGGLPTEHDKVASNSGPEFSEFAMLGAAAEPAAAPGNSGAHSNAQHASETTTEVAAAAGPAEPAAAPGNSGAHSNPQHASEAISEVAAAAGPAEPAAAPGNSGAHSNAQHASEATSEVAAAAGPAEPAAAPGNSGAHSNAQHASEATSEVAAAGEPASAAIPIFASGSVSSETAVDAIATSPDFNNGAGHAGQGISTPIPKLTTSDLSDPGGPAATSSEIGGVDREQAFHFDSFASASNVEAHPKLEALNDVPVQFVPHFELRAILKGGEPPLVDHAIDHRSDALHHAMVSSHNDLIV
ncbi:response regulator transcription factor [Bradyrhizobium sp. WSM1417]|uniref:response regulator transcription factor n=1 Tax=Bradyrhizobium sp. WSM1417 TaxID=754500 RepID=UPI0004B428AA|nr:response regulator transcription factor [Bradyrhizobium sp. WSM1417]